jgi:hypothetical protein
LKFEARFEDEAAVWPVDGPEAGDMVPRPEDIDIERE